MRSISICKAQRVVAEADIESLTITISQEIRCDGSVHEVHATFKSDARTLGDALATVLPGGTLDALTVELLRRKSTSLVVPRDAQ